MPTKPVRLSAIIAGLSVSAILLAAIALYARLGPHELQIYEARFKQKLKEYVAIVPHDAVPLEKPYLAGKAVIVEKTAQGGQISEVHLALPPDIRSEGPEEVSTVVLIEWKDVRVGEYRQSGRDSGTIAIRVDADIRIIDPKNRLLLARQTFTGGDPPSKPPRNAAHARGPKPIAKIVGYISALDRGTVGVMTE
jgi:hypothetical protein